MARHSKLEQRVVDGIFKYLDSLPRCWYFKVHGGPHQVMGIPDILGVVDGHFFAIEVKAEGEFPTVLQSRVLRLIRDAGGWAVWVDNVEEARLFIESKIAHHSRQGE